MLEVKLRCSKKIDDSMNGFDPKNSKKIFDKCLNELEKRGLTKVKFKISLCVYRPRQLGF